jgi:dihydroorotate dehydrogenase (NAD+) catalytic subunit
MNDTISMKVEIAGISMKNPVMTASGTCGYGLELTSYIDLSALGALVVKGISVTPRRGNPPPRIIETTGGMLNAIGLQNVGMKRFIDEYLPKLEAYPTPIIVNILGETFEEYGLLARTLGGHPGVKALEVNVSCPNVQEGGIAFGADPDGLGELVKFLRTQTGCPLIIKLSPNSTDIASIAQSAEEAGADALSLINTVKAMAVDIRTRRPILANVVGGLSGPAIKPVALRMVWEVARNVTIPVIGIGGIMSAQDAIEFLICGATAIQVGTANLLDPMASIRIIEGIREYLRAESIEDVNAIIGTLILDPAYGTQQ